MGITQIELYIFSLFGAFVSVTPLLMLVFFTSNNKIPLLNKWLFMSALTLSTGLIPSFLTDLSQPTLSTARETSIILISTLVQVMWCWLFFKKKTLAICGMASFFSILFKMIEGGLSVLRFSFLDQLTIIPAHLFLLSVHGGISLVVVILLIKKYPAFLQKVGETYELAPLAIVTIIVDLAYGILPTPINLFLRELGLDVASSRLIINVYLIVSGIFVYTLVNVFANGLAQKRLLVDHETTILQQETYVKKLELIQADMRLLQLDYQEMINSANSTTPIEDIKEYLGQALTSFDEELSTSIRQINQLTAIEIMEVRHFVLQKLTEMEQQGIEMDLEVFTPVAICGITVSDLIAYLEESITTAMAAVKDSDSPKIHLILLQEQGQLSVLVKYLASDNQVFQGTGKGEGGLRNYRNVARRTLREADYVIQSLKIA